MELPLIIWLLVVVSVPFRGLFFLTIDNMGRWKPRIVIWEFPSPYGDYFFEHEDLELAFKEFDHFRVPSPYGAYFFEPEVYEKFKEMDA